MCKPPALTNYERRALFTLLTSCVTGRRWKWPAPPYSGRSEQKACSQHAHAGMRSCVHAIDEYWGLSSRWLTLSQGATSAPDWGEGFSASRVYGSGAPVPDEPTNNVRPSGNVRFLPFARRVPSLARYPSTTIFVPATRDCFVSPRRKRCVAVLA